MICVLRTALQNSQKVIILEIIEFHIIKQVNSFKLK